MSSLNVRAVSTSILHPADDLHQFVISALESSRDVLEECCLVISSKIVSLAESRLVPQEEINKTALIHREADRVLGNMPYGSILTIKHGLLINSAGIDESNSENGDYILYPSDPFESAARIHRALQVRFGWRRFGVLLSDSRTSPLRRGVTGVALAHYGFHGVRNQIGQKDLFGAPLQMTQVNVADAIAAAAVFCMGESNEQTPLAIVEAPLHYESRSTDDHRRDCIVPLAEDLYSPLLLRQSESS
jgi:F420-0:gamma-glutamyl ligase